MNLDTKEITIIDNRVVSDKRDGVNNAKIKSNIGSIHRQPCCIFTERGGREGGVVLLIKTDNRNRIRVCLDAEQLVHLQKLLDPYHG